MLQKPSILDNCYTSRCLAHSKPFSRLDSPGKRKEIFDFDSHQIEAANKKRKDCAWAEQAGHNTYIEAGRFKCTVTVDSESRGEKQGKSKGLQRKKQSASTYLLSKTKHSLLWLQTSKRIMHQTELNHLTNQNEQIVV